NGSAQQTVNFCCGVGPASRRFQDLVLANPAGVVMPNDVFVAGRLIAFGTPEASPLLIGNGRSITAAGVNINGLTLDNARLTLNDGAITQFDNVVFRNYSPTATPLTLNRTTLNATFTGLQFTTAPTSGRYIVANDIDGSATPAQLTVAASKPLNGLAKTTTTGGFVLNWGSPSDDTDGD